jgi:AbrB family looped-hinge helix DNA binding protein
MVWTATLSSKGQLVLPKAIRDRLGLKPGDKVVFMTRQDRIELQSYSGNILDWYGAVEVRQPQDWELVAAETQRRRAEEIMRESEGD